jgi:hypothetical protein
VLSFLGRSHALNQTLGRWRQRMHGRATAA